MDSTRYSWRSLKIKSSLNISRLYIYIIHLIFFSCVQIRLHRYSNGDDLFFFSFLSFFSIFFSFFIVTNEQNIPSKIHGSTCHADHHEPIEVIIIYNNAFFARLNDFIIFFSAKNVRFYYLYAPLYYYYCQVPLTNLYWFGPHIVF